jgi:deoxyribodipyrimidine photolyase-related protein
MITGQFALLAEIEPRQALAWHQAMFVDAVEWAALPNTLALALDACGGRLGTPPHLAGGQAIERMSNYCQGCRYRPAQREGEAACPFTVLYWHFLLRHEDRLRADPRTAPLVRSLGLLLPPARAALAEKASHVLDHLDDL